MRRECRACGNLFPDPGPGKRDAPAGFCSVECHQAGKPKGGPRRTPQKQRKGPISPASPQQRVSVKERACIVCRGHAGHCHPAHVIDRSLTTEGQDDPRAVVPLCPHHHRLFDEGGLSILEHMEPHMRTELAWAVERVGLLTTLYRVTNDRTWKPDHREEAA